MNRRPLTLAAVASLLLCVATLALWVRSHFVGDRLFYHYDWDEDASTCWSQHSVQSGDGGVGYNFLFQRQPSRELRPFIDRKLIPAFQHEPRDAARPYFHFRTSDVLHWGFNVDHFIDVQATRRSRGLQVIVPYWFLALLFALPSGAWCWRRRVLRRRALAGFCPTCGYDLRATPNRCPECGAVPAEPPAR